MTFTQLNQEKTRSVYKDNHSILQLKRNKAEEEDAEVKFVEDMAKIPQSAPHVANIMPVKKFQPFRVIDLMLVWHDFNPRLPKFRVLERWVW